MAEYSASPEGEKFPIPSKEEYAPEMSRLEALAQAARAEGREVVVVMGVGFVGAVMAAIVADTVDKKTGRPSKFVIGCQRPSPPVAITTSASLHAKLNARIITPFSSPTV